ncbi:GLPGLI family protein [Flavobacterium sp.]|uniref:GLPGLI family protein n=1 Tax=Flavobacterium sp. TaxID=239 RepID=UPI003526C4C0
MKKALCILSFLVGSMLMAQDFQGMAVYESKTSTEEMMKNIPQSREITPEMRKTFEERMRKMFEKTFVLHFNRTASVYKEEEKLEAPGQGGGGRMMASMMGGGGTYYKNVKEKQYSVDKEMFGKEFLIIDSLPVYKWEMSSETKKIGNYTCFKATATIAIDSSDFRNFRFRRNRENETKKDSTKTNTNLMDQLEMPKEKVITAWYSPEIPINQGPDDYWGLPGLILEVSDDKTTILCSKIVLNTKDKVEIKAPTKGKEVTQKEYNEILKKKMDEMREMWQSRGGNRGRGPH